MCGSRGSIWWYIECFFFLIRIGGFILELDTDVYSAWTRVKVVALDESFEDYHDNRRMNALKKISKSHRMWSNINACGFSFFFFLYKYVKFMRSEMLSYNFRDCLARRQLIFFISIKYESNNKYLKIIRGRAECRSRNLLSNIYNYSKKPLAYK